MEDVLDRLRSASLAEWTRAALELRGLLASERAPELGADDFFMLLRPYLWYVHDVSFQDLADAASSALAVLHARREELVRAPGVERDFLGLGLFLAAYLEEASADASGIGAVVGSAELSAAVCASSLAGWLELHAQPEAASSLRALASILQTLESAKHAAYWCIRAVGDRFVAQLDLIHTLDPADQGFLLHALAGFTDNDEVARFYDDFIRVTPDSVLRREAEQFRDRLRAAARGPKLDPAGA